MNQHQDYDFIFKVNFDKIGASLIAKICGIEVESLENIPTTIPRTIERRADFVKMGIEKHSQLPFVVHLEVQTNNHLRMDSRMLVYYALLYDLYNVPVKQFVIYIGSGNWASPTVVKHEKLSFEYEVIHLNRIDYQVFSTSDAPEEIIMAILADFKGKEKSQVIQEILTCLKNKAKNKKKLHKLIMQMEILSNLRNLQPEIVKQLSVMSIDYDVKNDFRYQQGIEQGVAQGIEQGIEQGVAQGIEQGIEQGAAQGDLRRAKIVVKKMLLKGSFTIQEIADFADVTVDFVKNVQDEINTQD